MKIFLFGLLVSVLSCNDSSVNNHNEAKTHAAIPAIQETRNFTDDSVIRVSFPVNSRSATIRGKLNGIDKPVAVFIPVNDGEQLDVSIIPEDSIANIRINQLFMPGGKVDGPFGKTLQVKSLKKGDYKLVIGENLTQGDEWKGQFVLKVSLK